jgi:hypothetical protein
MWPSNCIDDIYLSRYSSITVNKAEIIFARLSSRLDTLSEGRNETEAPVTFCHVTGTHILFRTQDVATSLVG